MELLLTLEWDPHYDDTIEAIYDGIDASQRIMAYKDKWDDGHDEIQIARTMVSTHLAIARQPKSVEIPPEFCKYHKVFSNEESQHLPKHQPWDHKIDLTPGKQMRKTSVYCLMPPKKIALQDYITTGLKTGTLR